MIKEDILKYKYFIKRGDGFIMLINVLKQLKDDYFTYEALTITKTNTFTSINNGITTTNKIIKSLKIIHPDVYKDTYKKIKQLQLKHQELYNSFK